VRGAALDPADPLCAEWAVIVVGPYFSAALVARDLGDGGAERHRRFEYALTYERPVVIEAARSLLRRLGPAA
jgi:DICT domain-containing protein